jgi:two-component system alkaline phosphatase synthesis response regulator PhoP
MLKNSRRILIAEDNKVLADVLRFNLQRAGFQVVVANNGLLAIEQLKLATFDLLITDFQMPIVDGEELCKTVRLQLQIDQMPILICSAKGYEIDIARLTAQYRISQVIFKPFSMREIVALSEELTASKCENLNV